MTQPEFNRLPGRGTNIASYFLLYRTKDYLLQTASTFGFHEHYRRFYYGDIQAIVVRQTNLAAITNALLLVLTVAFLTVGMIVTLQQGDLVWSVLSFSLACVFLVPLVVSLRNGPHCVCHLRTAVQTQRLRSLGRLRHIRLVLAEIEPLIASAQGTFSPGELAQRLLNAGGESTRTVDSGAPPSEDSLEGSSNPSQSSGDPSSPSS